MNPVRLAHRAHVRIMVLLAALLLALGILALTAPAPKAAASARTVSWSALKWAEAHETGAWYCWGGTGGCYDCSGAVMSALVHTGYSMPRTTYQMLASGRIYRVAWRDRRPGDLYFWGNYHVEFVTLHGSFGAQQSGTRVGWHRLWGSPTVWRIR
jgi:cell wall-associated NlpC family hydrolase